MRIFSLLLALGLLSSSCNCDSMSHRSSYVISKSNAPEIEPLTELEDDYWEEEE